MFGVDKLQSKKRGWRIPESRLLLAAFFGPFGAYAAVLVSPGGVARVIKTPTGPDLLETLKFFYYLLVYRLTLPRLPKKA